MTQGLRISEFAARSGVTVKALRLYDRLGLLVPLRSRAIESMSRFYPREVWPAARAYYGEWPSSAWRQLHRDLAELRQ